eukprot:scaffold238273_cov17-Tisochrysis_lutea.AAC.1
MEKQPNTWKQKLSVTINGDIPTILVAKKVPIQALNLEPNSLSPPHRLDAGTQGCVVLSRTIQFSRYFQVRECVCEATPSCPGFMHPFPPKLLVPVFACQGDLPE